MPGFQPFSSGKVRDLFTTVNGDLLLVASDRISAYDVVLPTMIPDKGAILTALSVWWFDQLADVVGNHLLPDISVPSAVAERGLLCQRLDMFPVECVVRGYLTGSGLAEYRRVGAISGIQLPSGLVDGDQLPTPIFTPSTKAPVGTHDETVDFTWVTNTVGRRDAEALRDISLRIYERAHAIAIARGLILADTKFEFGRLPQSDDGQILLADEVLTPDSSRFWPVETWRPGNSQPSLDKQYIRDWLTSAESGWHPDAASPPPELPPAVVAQTRSKYLAVFERLTGHPFTARGPLPAH